MSGLALGVIGLWVILQTTYGPLATKLGLLTGPTANEKAQQNLQRIQQQQQQQNQPPNQSPGAAALSPWGTGIITGPSGAPENVAPPPGAP